MHCRATTFILSICLASTAVADSFMPRALDPEHDVDRLNRAEAKRLVGKELLAEPAGSALYGDVHLYDRFPYVEARYVHVTSDAGWQRLLYGIPGEAPKAFGSAGVGPGEFIEPRGIGFAPDGRLFVADRALGRITVLQLVQSGETPVLEYVSHADGFAQPMDVSVHDGGTPEDASDDRILVAEAGAHRVTVLSIRDSHLTRLTEFGRRGPWEGEFLYPRAVTVGRRKGVSVDEVFVADSGSHRLVRLSMHGSRLEWQDSQTLPMEATSVDSDHHGNLLVTSRRLDSMWKLTNKLEVVAEFVDSDAPLKAPRDVAVPFVWVHDHRSGDTRVSWRGEGSAVVLEAWSDESGVRLLDVGVAIESARMVSASGVQMKLTDTAELSAEYTDAGGQRRTASLGVHPAGTQVIELPFENAGESVILQAKSLYDPSRSDTVQLNRAAVASKAFMEQNYPNPFNPSTTISFQIPRDGKARLDVFDVRGRFVQTLYDGNVTMGRQSVTWNGRDAQGKRVSSGIYFARFKFDGSVSVQKMVLAQ